MQGIVRLYWDNQLEIMRSSKILDKGEHYEVHYEPYSNGYVTKDYYVKKNRLGVPFRDSYGRVGNFLYVSASKFDEDNEKWIQMVKEFREPSDCRKWLESV